MTKMLVFPMKHVGSQVNTSEGMGIWKGPEELKSKQPSLHHIQCSDEAQVGLLTHSQVNLT